MSIRDLSDKELTDQAQLYLDRAKGMPDGYWQTMTKDLNELFLIAFVCGAQVTRTWYQMRDLSEQALMAQPRKEGESDH